MNSLVSSTHDGVTYYQQVSFCGKPRCRKCREGIGHGPYWYAYRSQGGRTTRTYVGKTLPPEETPSPLAALGPLAAPGAQTVLHITVLGRFQLERRAEEGWQPITEGEWEHQQVRTLLGCLLAAPGRMLGREQIVDQLWPELDLEKGIARLDRAVHSLRHVLEPDLARLAESRLLRTYRQQLHLLGQDEVWVDADAFDGLLDRAQATPDERVRGSILEQADALYVGDFLPEAPEAGWAAIRRQALRRSWIGMLLDLADVFMARGEMVRAIALLDRLLAADPTNEAAVGRLMLSLAHQGRRSEALRAFEQLATLLRERYRSAPLPLTRTLYEAVREGEEVEPSLLYNLHAAISPSPAAPKVSAPPYIGRRHQSPLVGRASEQEALRYLLNVTETDRPREQHAHPALPSETRRHPQLLLLCGEPGIGKTRLAEEAGRDAQRRGWTVAWGRTYAQESAIPYSPWIEVLRQCLAHSYFQVREQELSAHPLFYAPLGTLLPELQDRLPSVQLPVTASLTPEQEEGRLREAILKLFTALASHTPLLIVLDDLHWADAKSSELLAYLARRVSGYPILLVATYRQSELPPLPGLRALLADLSREQTALSLPIERLSDAEVAALLGHLPSADVARIQERAAGNPFFAEELARSIESRAQAPERPAAPLPDTIAAVLDLRLAALSPACQRLLGKASVVGGSFEFSVIKAMGQEQDRVLDLVEEALGAGVLTEDGVGLHHLYAFWHPLLAGHLYDRLSAARRASYHAQAAHVLEQHYQGHGREHAALIVSHLQRGGGTPLEIAHYAELAGDYAYRLSAYLEAERYYRLALEQRGWSPRPHGQGVSGALAGEERLQRISLLERLGSSMRERGENAEGFVYLDQAVRLHAQVVAETGENRAQSALLYHALLLVHIALLRYDVADFATAVRYLDEAASLLTEAGIERGTPWAALYFERGYVLWMQGHAEEALATARQALSLYEEALGAHHDEDMSTLHRPDVPLTLSQRTLAGDPADIARCCRLLGTILVASQCGQPQQALAYLYRAKDLFEQLECKRELAVTWHDLGSIHMLQGQHLLAVDCYQRSLEHGKHLDDIQFLGTLKGNLGIVLFRQGHYERSRETFLQALRLLGESQDPIYLCLFSSLFAQTLLELGQCEEAQAWIRRAIHNAALIHHGPSWGTVLYALGALRLALALAQSEHALPAPEVVTSLASGARVKGGMEESRHLLVRAKRALDRALDLQRMPELWCEGLYLLAQTVWLLGEEQAVSVARRAVEEAQRCGVVWVEARAKGFLASVLAALEMRQEAAALFEEAIDNLCGGDSPNECRRVRALAAAHFGPWFFSGKEPDLPTLVAR